MSDPESTEPEVSAAVEAMGRRVFPDGAICTGWVLVTEWVDSDGDYWCHVASDDHNPPWRHAGMIAYAADSDLISDDVDEDEDE